MTLQTATPEQDFARRTQARGQQLTGGGTQAVLPEVSGGGGAQKIGLWNDHDGTFFITTVEDKELYKSKSCPCDKTGTTLLYVDAQPAQIRHGKGSVAPTLEVKTGAPKRKRRRKRKRK